MSEEFKVLRPLGLLDLFDEAFSLYRKNFVIFFGIGALVYIPFNILSGLFSQDPLAFSNSAELDPSLLTGLLFTSILSIFAFGVANGAITKAVSDRYIGHPTSIGSSYAFVLARAFPFFFTVLLAGIVIGLGALLIIPAIIFSFMFVFVSQVFVVEDLRFGQALGRSRSLAKENWVRILLVGIFIVLITVIVSFLSVGITDIFQAAGQSIIAAVIEGLLQAFILPLVSAAYVLLYFDIRVRKEGYDLELLAKELEDRGAPHVNFPPGQGGSA
jgi:hypothetical protein